MRFSGLSATMVPDDKVGGASIAMIFSNENRRLRVNPRHFKAECKTLNESEMLGI